PGNKEARITVTFENVPAGGKVDVVGSVYSNTNWLAGQWDSGWVDGTPDVNDQVAISGNITENLVPLMSTTSYSQRQTVAYAQAPGHYWQGIQFSIDGAL